MGGSWRSRWKLSFHRSYPSPPRPPPPPRSQEAPAEFLCPITHVLMADPVILPSGHTFERACLQACSDLALSPPGVPLPLPLLLIPNSALKAAILNWCDRSGVPRPAPPSPDAACHLVRLLKPSAPPPEPAPADGADEPAGPTTPPPSVRGRKPKSKSVSSRSAPSSNASSSSSYPSSELTSASADVALKQESPDSKAREAPKAFMESIVESNPTPIDCLEEQILSKLVDSDPSDQEAAMAALRQATRESRERRLALCTPRLLAALREMLLSRHAGVQTNAAAAVVNLSLEPPNKVPVVRSGAVPPLVEVLKGGNLEAREHAAGAVFSLALEEQNRAAIGVLGSVPPLVQLFSRAGDGHRSRRDAGMALYHLSLAAANLSKIARAPGAARALLSVASAPGEEAAVRRLAMMVMCNLAGWAEGRAVLMDAGAVAAVAGLMRKPPPAAAAVDEEYCIAALYGMSRGSPRFRGLARAAGAEEVLGRVAEGRGGCGEVGKEMAKKVLRALRAEEDEMAGAAAALELADYLDDDDSIVSEGLVSLRRRHRDLSGSPTLSTTPSS